MAEVILAHPDHSILLAGTTATDGDQQARVDLSNRRAAAVKNLLVSAFGIPEDQLTTIGLGFEADPFVRGQDRDANGKFVESEGAKTGASSSWMPTTPLLRNCWARERHPTDKIKANPPEHIRGREALQMEPLSALCV